MSKPSEAEVKAAEAILAAAGNKEKAKNEKKKVNAQFNYYYSKVCTDEVERNKMLGTKGDLRHHALVDFLAKGLASKKGVQATTFTVKSTEENEEQEEEFSVEQLEKELGERRAKKLIDLKAFGEPKACPLTGSKDEDLITFTYTRKKLRRLKQEVDSSEIKGETEATDEDLKALKALKEVKAGTSASSGAPGPTTGPPEMVPVKTETKTDEEIMAEKIEELIKDPQSWLRWAQDIETEETRVFGLAKENPMAVALVSELKKNVPRLVKTIEMLQKLNRGDKIKEKHGLRSLVLLLSEIKSASAHNHAWAITFGHATRKKQRR